MDESRFDALTRSLAGTGSRRGFIGGLFGLGAGLAGSRQQAPPARPIRSIGAASASARRRGARPSAGSAPAAAGRPAAATPALTPPATRPTAAGAASPVRRAVPGRRLHGGRVPRGWRLRRLRRVHRFDLRGGCLRPDRDGLRRRRPMRLLRLRPGGRLRLTRPSSALSRPRSATRRPAAAWRAGTTTTARPRGCASAASAASPTPRSSAKAGSAGRRSTAAGQVVNCGPDCPLCHTCS